MPGSSDRRIAFRVEGRVQGVGFRAATVRQAEALGLGGFVGNTRDGAVTGEAQGEHAAIERFVAWLGTGPAFARVDRVTVDPLPPGGAAEPFAVRR